MNGFQVVRKNDEKTGIVIHGLAPDF